jgi:aryl carrier-like protein
MFELEQINIEENFFDLGATSLLLVQMHERLRTSLQTELSVVTLFQHPTIRALAMHLDQRAAPDTAPAGATTSGATSQTQTQTQRQRAEQQKQALARLRTRPKK